MWAGLLAISVVSRSIRESRWSRMCLFLAFLHGPTTRTWAAFDAPLRRLSRGGWKKKEEASRKNDKCFAHFLYLLLITILRCVYRRARHAKIICLLWRKVLHNFFKRKFLRSWKPFTTKKFSRFSNIVMWDSHHLEILNLLYLGFAFSFGSFS